MLLRAEDGTVYNLAHIAEIKIVKRDEKFALLLVAANTQQFAESPVAATCDTQEEAEVVLKAIVGTVQGVDVAELIDSFRSGHLRVGRAGGRTGLRA